MGCSIYLRNHCDTVQYCRSMLPQNITEAASLAEGQRRPALTFEFKTSRGRTGDVTFQQFFRSTIRLRESMSFEEAARVLEDVSPPSAGVRHALRALWEVTKKAMAQRLQTDEAYALRCPWLQDTGEASDARRLVEFWMTQVNECSGRLISARRTSELRCLHCFPCPDGNHFSRLSMLCRDATFRALQREGHESLITKLHESPSRCRENIAGVLKHALRLAASQSGAVSPILISVLATSLAEFVSLSSVFTLLPGRICAFSSSFVLSLCVHRLQSRFVSLALRCRGWSSGNLVALCTMTESQRCRPVLTSGAAAIQQTGAKLVTSLRHCFVR
ncbi:unnamed protein product [Symbiodinium necroappetens]|uniref:RNB domain-containing protein n=1 Tax=Symbiodinium necroappetens TaxID=1628268 RepID=A0A812KXZ8_9DINO|nr:unnamed protein product [Symbiodinium necroappetens]